jgi:hypothetical protein
MLCKRHCFAPRHMPPLGTTRPDCLPLPRPGYRSSPHQSLTQQSYPTLCKAAKNSRGSPALYSPPHPTASQDCLEIKIQSPRISCASPCNPMRRTASTAAKTVLPSADLRSPAHSSAGHRPAAAPLLPGSELAHPSQVCQSFAETAGTWLHTTRSGCHGQAPESTASQSYTWLPVHTEALRSSAVQAETMQDSAAGKHHWLRLFSNGFNRHTPACPITPVLSRAGLPKTAIPQLDSTVRTEPLDPRPAGAAVPRPTCHSLAPPGIPVRDCQARTAYRQPRPLLPRTFPLVTSRGETAGCGHRRPYCSTVMPGAPLPGSYPRRSPHPASRTF